MTERTDASQIQNPEHQLHEPTAEEILAANTQFFWRKPKVPWAGLNQDQLKGLVTQVAGIIKYKPEQARKTEILFGDVIPIVFEDGSRPDHINNAYCFIKFDENGQVTGTSIVFNRSRQVMEEVGTPNARKEMDADDPKSEFYRQLGVLDESLVDADMLEFRFDSPKEAIAWQIAEEMHHAKLNLMAGSEQRVDEWDKNYANIFKKRGIVRSEMYSVDLQEVAASRIALLTLAQLADQDGRSERARYIRDLYKKSLAERTNVFPILPKNLIDETYVETRPRHQRIKERIQRGFQRPPKLK